MKKNWWNRSRHEKDFERMSLTKRNWNIGNLKTIGKRGRRDRQRILLMFMWRVHIPVLAFNTTLGHWSPPFVIQARANDALSYKVYRKNTENMVSWTISYFISCPVPHKRWQLYSIFEEEKEPNKARFADIEVTRQAVSAVSFHLTGDELLKCACQCVYRSSSFHLASTFRSKPL